MKLYNHKLSLVSFILNEYFILFLILFVCLLAHALPLFKAERKKSWRVQMMKARKDPVKSRRPDLPVTGPGQGGRLASAGNTFASFIARNLGVKSKPDDIDPREALLRHAKEAAENPYWVSPAYSATQPKPIFAEIPKDDDDGEPSEKRPHVPV